MTELEYFDDPFWEPLQIVAWMCLRNPNYVHRSSSAYFEWRRFKNTRSPNSYGEPIPLDIPIALSDIRAIDRIMADDELRLFEFENVHLAIEQLYQILKKGEINAYGVENGIGELKPIEAFKWADLTIVWDDLPKHTAACSSNFSDKATTWNDLRFKREEVLTMWPDINADDGDSIRYGSASAKRQCTQWLIKLMGVDSTTIKNNDNEQYAYIGAHNKSAPYLNNDEMYEIAKSKFPGLSKNLYKVAKAQAIEETGNTNWNKSAKKPTKK